MKLKDNTWLNEKAVESGEIDGYPYWIAYHPCQSSFNGYVYFKQRPTIETDYNGILTYVPVHGGITYANEEGKGGIIYGFDTGHCDSNEYPISDKQWIKKQIKKMIVGILMAKKVEKKYLVAKKEQTKARYAQMVWDTDEEKENEYNFGISLNLLCGKL